MEHARSLTERYLPIICYYAVTAGVIGLFPSIASFFFLQLTQRKGPSHGLDPGEKKGPELTDNPSLGS